MNDVVNRYRHVAALGQPQTAEDYVALIHGNSKFLHALLGRLPAQLPASIDTEDLLQEACAAVLRAFQTFQPWRGKLHLWVELSVRNDIRSWLRDNCPLSRYRTSQISALNHAVNRLAQRFMRYPTDAEIAAELDWKIPAVRAVVEAAYSQQLLSLDRMSATLRDAGPDPFEVAWTRDCDERLAHALRRLSAEERELLNKHYVEDMSLRDIARATARPSSSVTYQHHRCLLNIGSLIDPIGSERPDRPKPRKAARAARVATEALVRCAGWLRTAVNSLLFTPAPLRRQ